MSGDSSHETSHSAGQPLERKAANSDLRPAAPQTTTASFLDGGGEMGELIRSLHWSETPLGPVETWPHSLKTAVGIMLGAGSPMGICWGAELILLYNDAWRALIGEKHPHALGRPAREVIPESWDTFGPMFAGVMSGHGAAEAHDQRLLLNRHGRIEDAWFDYRFSPIPCADGSMGGILCIAVETTDRIWAERARRESEDKLQFVATNIADILFLQDSDLRYVWISSAADPLEENQVVGKADADLLPAEEAERLTTIKRKVLETGIGTKVELQLSPGGITRWYEAVYEPSRNAEGQIVGVVSYSRDITERKLAEEALLESEERALWLARFPEENPDPVLRVSIDGTVLYRNPAAAMTPAWQCEVGQPLPQPVLRRLVSQGMAHGLTFEQDVELGNTSYSVAVSPVREEGYANVYGHNITARKRAEEALRQSEARRKVAEAVEVERKRFNDMLDILPAYVVLLSPDYHVPFANRTFRERFGESHGERCHEYLFGRTEPCEGCESYRALETHAPHQWEWTGPDGRTYDVYDFPFTDTDGSPLIMEMGIDITERRQAEEALVQAERLAVIGRMAASLAHEINNPIQSVVGCLGLAMEVLEQGEDATRFMDVALEESERAARIVQRMRSLGRSEEAHKEPAAVGELVEKVLILTHNQAQNQQVEVIWERGDGLPPVPMVRDRIQQVFLNLVLNAIEAMPEGGQLRIRAAHTQEPAGVQVSFADTGVGIAPEEVARMFEAFHSTKQLGLGLGLHVSRNIVQEHGGWIDVRSEVGQGATFTVWLPEDGA